MIERLRAVAGAVLFFAASAAAAVADDLDPTELRDVLVERDLLRADFHQEKTLRALSRPLVSRGRLVFDADQGVLWQIVEPYVVFVLIKPGEIVEWGEDGEKRRVATKSNPVFRALTDIIVAMLSGDTGAVEKHFALASLERDDGWHWVLRPKSDLLRAAISGIEISGDQFVELIEVTEIEGDMTTIRFGGFSVDPPELDENEKAHFSQ